MLYTIATLDATQTDESLEIYKTGNRYGVYISCGGGSRRRDFASLDSAFALFAVLSEWIVKGLYDSNEHVRFFEAF